MILSGAIPFSRFTHLLSEMSQVQVLPGSPAFLRSFQYLRTPEIEQKRIDANENKRRKTNSL
jgi:hypothetical protein